MKAPVLESTEATSPLAIPQVSKPISEIITDTEVFEEEGHELAPKKILPTQAMSALADVMRNGKSNRLSAIEAENPSSTEEIPISGDLVTSKGSNTSVTEARVSPPLPHKPTRGSPSTAARPKSMLSGAIHQDTLAVPGENLSNSESQLPLVARKPSPTTAPRPRTIAIHSDSLEPKITLLAERPKTIAVDDPATGTERTEAIEETSSAESSVKKRIPGMYGNQLGGLNALAAALRTSGVRRHEDPTEQVESPVAQPIPEFESDGVESQPRNPLTSWKAPEQRFNSPTKGHTPLVMKKKEHSVSGDDAALEKV